MCVTAFRGRAWGSTCLCGCVWARSAHTAPGAQGSVRAGAGCAAAPAGTKAGTKHSPALARRVGVSPSLRDAGRRGRTRVPRRPPERPPHPFSLRRVAPYFSALSSSVPVLCASPALSRPLFVWLGLCLDRLFSSVFLSIPCPSPASPPQFSVFQCLRVLLFFYLFLYVSLRVSLLLIFFFLCALLLTLFLYSLSPSLSLSDCLLIDECLQASASSPGPLSHRHAVAQH